jgi:hypothetical protein
MTRTTAWRALAAVLTSSFVTLAPAVPAVALVPGFEGPPVATPPRGPVRGEVPSPAFWRKQARQHPGAARFQMPAVKEIAPQGGGGTTQGDGAAQGGDPARRIARADDRRRRTDQGGDRRRRAAQGGGGERRITQGGGGSRITQGGGGPESAGGGDGGRDLGPGGDPGRQSATRLDRARPRVTERRRPNRTPGRERSGTFTVTPGALVGDPPSQRPTSSTARIKTADLPATPLRETATEGAPDGLGGVIGGGVASLALLAFAGSRLRLRLGRGRGRA